MAEYLDLLKALNRENVKFVIVGGYASVIHGSSIVTVDLDIAIPTDYENDKALVRALESFHPNSLDLNTSEYTFWDERPKIGPVTSITTTAGHVDILRTLKGIDDFGGLFQRSDTFLVAGQDVRVATIEDLINMRIAAGRAKDQPHIQQLLALKKLNDNS